VTGGKKKYINIFGSFTEPFTKSYIVHNYLCYSFTPPTNDSNNNMTEIHNINMVTWSGSRWP